MLTFLADTASAASSTTLPYSTFDYSAWIPHAEELPFAASVAGTTLLIGIVLLLCFRTLITRFRIARPVLATLITLTVYATVWGFKSELLRDPLDPVTYWFKRAVAAILLFVALRFFDRLVIVPVLSRGGRIPVARFVQQIINIIIALFAILAFGAREFNWEISTFLAGSAVVSIVLGLALQETLGNFFSGLVLQASPPFALGHFITIGSYEGRIVDMTWRAVTLHTTDDNFVVIPNANIAKAEIINYHTPTTATARTITIGFDPDVDPVAVLDTLKAAALETPGVLQTPEPKSRMVEFTPSGITYELKFWINEPVKYKDIQHMVRLHMWYRLAERNIVIPMPSLVVEHLGTIEKRQERDKASLARREAALAAVPLLAPLSPAQIRELAQSASNLSLIPGQILFRQKDAGDSFYVISSGTVDVLLAQENSSDFKQVATLTPGNFFGEMSALTGQPRSATIRAAGNGPLSLIQIEKKDLVGIFQADPSIMEKVSEIVAKRNAERQAIIANAGNAAPADAIKNEQKSILRRMMSFFRFDQPA